MVPKPINLFCQPRLDGCILPTESSVLMTGFGRMQSSHALLLINYRLGLCHRRQWPQPSYESYSTNPGVACVVRVNNREYKTDTTYENETLARENAAMRAYLICRNFSVSDGMYPSGHNKGGVLQGMPVAIGTERRSVYTEDLDSSASSGSRSGGSSPETHGTFRAYRESRQESGMDRVLVYGQRRR